MAILPSLLAGGLAPSSNIAIASVTTTGVVNSAGDISTTVAGKGLKIKEGSNAKMGTATLTTGGEVVVSTTAVTASSRIMLTPQSGTLNIGSVWISARNAAQDFTIKSSNTLDTRAVAWIIFEPA